jgi:hypothetical protein
MLGGSSKQAICRYRIGTNRLLNINSLERRAQDLAPSVQTCPFDEAIGIWKMAERISLQFTVILGCSKRIDDDNSGKRRGVQGGAVSGWGPSARPSSIRPCGVAIGGALGLGAGST